ncbi:MAG: Spy/CpxP family protein refolding chaperone [Thermodesulfobacteriota bacterium]
MKKKRIIGVGLVLAVALVATVAFAGGMGRGFGPGYGIGYSYPAIPNLTAEQSSKIQALQKAYLDEITPLQQDLLKKKTELRGLWLSPNPDQTKITALQKEILNLQAKITEKSTNLKLEIRKVLTPEQQAQLSVYGSGMGRGMKMGRMGRW